ncbi:bifunctional tRNA (5-methylaminomethyl-2-thiouridine)(34)-methyltransferase MnmD/FAD-dependent 5-carboxymethylaminomethyl-2-thiouridine(34) oxidoreductase MnmC [Marinicella litoralis]|uniref:tRNA 5-methylaminomethyl-2-thiouridine biosynthesis bifunctional protein MnmC n=1 Tax=Marinicella litoralis TaxID=644220 RepID=A0A4R6X9D7_9GAMM|nr:bifunctional tRNA (5-methylaminomethyl-2-thiouridine)(34)-methyltransferase MnmD/FAD-dependent 5-carboxymethylaminomethyl-2-thiouridine(34) oxidoreductase MnmC [Marinicella litoralis]TDR14649.1 tRNA 5-methylaminomethyl-2-thiouridine biosynthesis bifunctional protein [Marinicella litoralis]
MNPLDLKFIKPAVITDKRGQPYAKDFDDVYFNDLNGLDETNHVFLGGNQLLERWGEKQQKPYFCIGETGFGSGLNFLATCLAWQQCPKKPAKLHFISTELHPMSAGDLKSAHQLFPEIKTFSQKLLAKYDSFRAGIHQLAIDEDITLTLLLGDATENLKQLHAQVDAWFLDGFAPSRNPAMWSAALFNAIAQLSEPGTTIATYSAAAVVKKGLTQAGFKLTKQTGFGPKRDMLVGTMNEKPAQAINRQPWHPLPKANTQDKKVTILGGGIAGLCLARSFNLAGFHTTVIDQHSQPLKQASGQGYAMVMPLITAQKSPEALFYLRAFEHAQQAYSEHAFHQIGICELFPPEPNAKRIKNNKKLSLPDSLIQVNSQNIKYPNAGYVDNQVLAAEWSSYIDQWITAKVSCVEHHQQWQIQNELKQTIHSCDLLIIAAGMYSQVLTQAHQDLGLTAKLGQTNQIQTNKNLKLSHVILNQGYLIPIKQTALTGQYLIGATFDHLPATSWLQSDFSEYNHLQRNLTHWQQTDYAHHLSTATLVSKHTAIRATTQDHLPVCGPIINQQQFESAYQDLHHGRHWQEYPPAEPIKNLYVMTGLGSRGFTSAPLLADYLLSMITGQPLPLEADLCKIIHPNRFNFRNLKKTPTYSS